MYVTITFSPVDFFTIQLTIYKTYLIAQTKGIYGNACHCVRDNYRNMDNNYYCEARDIEYHNNRPTLNENQWQVRLEGQNNSYKYKYTRSCKN